MLKWLFWGLILLVFWGLFRSRSRLAKPPSAPAGESAAMVACARCRVYLPEAEALRKDGNTFCCQAHYEEWKRHP